MTYPSPVSVTEKIEFYQRWNFWLETEDMLREIEGKKRIHLIKIKENESKIEELRNSIRDF